MIGLIKDELGEKIMTEFATLRPKPYSHLTNGSGKNKKKQKRHKKVIMKKS